MPHVKTGGIGEDRFTNNEVASAPRSYIEAREVERRLAARPPHEPAYRRGWEALYLDHVLQADMGCDLDILRARDDEPPVDYPRGLLAGWVLGD